MYHVGKRFIVCGSHNLAFCLMPELFYHVQLRCSGRKICDVNVIALFKFFYTSCSMHGCLVHYYHTLAKMTVQIIKIYRKLVCMKSGICPKELSSIFCCCTVSCDILVSSIVWKIDWSADRRVSICCIHSVSEERLIKLQYGISILF